MSTRQRVQFSISCDVGTRPPVRPLTRPDFELGGLGGRYLHHVSLGRWGSRYRT